jgi:hypothetical protein
MGTGRTNGVRSQGKGHGMGKGLYCQARQAKVATRTRTVPGGSVPTPGQAATAAGMVLAGGGIVPQWLMAAAMQGACPACASMAGTAAGVAPCAGMQGACSHA